MNSKLSFGMIGGGGRADAHSFTLKKLGFPRLVACDANPDMARKHAAEWGYGDTVTDHRELLKRKEVDAVVIVLPHSVAGPVVLDAIRAGKHVITEKPLCSSMALGREIAEAAARCGKVIMVSHNYRLEPAVLAVRDAIQDGKAGKIFLAQGRLIGPPFYLALRPGYRARTKENPSTVTLGNGVHGFDMLRFWLGEASSVSALFGHAITAPLGGTGEDTSACRVEFRGGALAQFTVSDGDVSLAGGAWQFDLYGTEGLLRWPEAVLLPRHPECYENWSPNRKPVPPVSLLPEPGRVATADILERIYTHMLGVIEGRETSCLTVAEALKSLEVALAAVDSADAGGKPIALK